MVKSFEKSSSDRRDVGSISSSGARQFEGTFFPKRKGPFSKNKKGTSLSIAKSWGAPAHSAPDPTSIYVRSSSKFDHFILYSCLDPNYFLGMLLS